MTDLTLRCVIDAPVQRVYAAWTDPEVLRQWLVPGNAVASRAVADVAAGGDIPHRDARDRRAALARARRVPGSRTATSSGATWRWEGSDAETAGHHRGRT